MRDYQTKQNKGGVPDSITIEKHGAGEFNSMAQELENACTRAGLTLAPADGTAETFLQLAESLFLHGGGATSVVAAGTADAITTTPVTGASGFVIPADYDNFDGARISFIPTGPNTGAVTLSIGQTGGTQLGTKKVFDSSAGALSGGEIGTDRIELIFDAAADSSAGAWLLVPWVEGAGVSAGLIQHVIGTTASVSTTTSLIPDDDTLPQNSEGVEVVTRAITPLDATNRLIIRATVHMAHSTASSNMTIALFQDATVNALAVATHNSADNDRPSTVILHHELAAGTTSETIFKIRVGDDDAGTLTINGKSGARIFGGGLISSIEILEVTA